MALTEAPGKLVLSGAYAVLEGAPALVAAVNRRVRADSSRRADFTTPEFEVAEPGVPMPWFDASQLRQDGRKLGLGSSAAILSATLGALYLDANPDATEKQLRDAVFAEALTAHRKAQGGGSGVDVAASVYGGVLCARLAEGGGLTLNEVELPSGLHLAALFSGLAASTPELIGKVKRFGAQEPVRYRDLVARLERAAETALDCCAKPDAAGLVRALRAQCAGLGTLGELSGANIVTGAARRLDSLAERQNGCILPAGAGGGDIVLFAGTSPMSEELAALAGELAHERLDLEFAARGLGPIDEDTP